MREVIEQKYLDGVWNLGKVEIPTIGYKTLKQFYSILKKQNKFCKTRNIRVKFDITLPIRN